MSKEMSMNDVMEATKALQKQNPVSQQEMNATIKNTKTTQAYDRSINSIEAETYDVAKAILEEAKAGTVMVTGSGRESTVVEEGVVKMKAVIDNIAKDIGHEDQIGVAAKAIADTLAPVPTFEKAAAYDAVIAQAKAEGGLYNEATIEILEAQKDNDPSSKQASLMKGVNNAITTIADIHLEKGFRSNMTEKLKAELGVKPQAQIQTDVEVPKAPDKKESEIPDAKNIIPHGEAFDAAKNRELNSNARRSSRLKNIRSKLGGTTSGYFPHSGLKFEMNPTVSILEKEEMYTDLAKMYASDGLKNMSNFITEASRHVTLLVGDKDPNIKTPKDLLRKKLHFNDFKYLLIYKAISAGETEVEVEERCTHCGHKHVNHVPLMEVVKGWSEEQFASFDEYNADRTYEEITKVWKDDKDVNTFVINGFDTPNGCIFDDFFNAEYNNIYFTVTYSEPTIEKYMNIKNDAFQIMIYKFRNDIPGNVGNSEDEVMEYISTELRGRAETLQSIIETLAIIDTIKISYVYQDPKVEGPGLVVGEDLIIPGNLSLQEKFDILEDMEPKVFADARQYLIGKYQLMDRAKTNLVRQGYDPELVPADQISIPSLLEEMIYVEIKDVVCPSCAQKYDSEVSSLWLGFRAIQKLKQKMKF